MIFGCNFFLLPRKVTEQQDVEYVEIYEKSLKKTNPPKMPSMSEGSNAKQSGPDSKNQPKRKSSSNHTSPTAPSSTTLKKSPTRSTAQSKTQSTLKTVSAANSKTKLTSFTSLPGTSSTLVSRKIKQEKLNETSKTPDNKKSPIVLSSPDEDDLYSEEVYKDTKGDAPTPGLATVNEEPQVIKVVTNANAVTPHSNSSPRRQKTGRGGRALTAQGRGGRAGGRLLPPPRLRSTTQNASNTPKIPPNLATGFDQESDKQDTPSNNQPVNKDALIKVNDDRVDETKKVATPPQINEKDAAQVRDKTIKNINDEKTEETDNGSSSQKVNETKFTPVIDQDGLPPTDASTTTDRSSVTSTTPTATTDQPQSGNDQRNSEEHSATSTQSSPKTSNLKQSKYNTSTKVQANLSGSPINARRYSMNFPVTAEQRGTKGLRDALVNIFSEMQKLCPEVSILPWKEDEKKESLKKTESIPSTITLLQKYFDGARTLLSGGRVYTKINIGFAITADRETFQNDFSQWCKDSDIKFYRATVQHHNVKSICWLAYLTNHTNCELLSRTMTAAFKASTGKYIEIGLSWRMLNNQKDLPKDDRVYTVLVECPYETMSIIKRFLRSCSHQKIYPGSTKFRVINEYWAYITEPNKRKYRYTKDRHKYFLEQIGLCSTAQPLEIDRRIPGTKSTIRSTLLGIRDKTDNHKVFHSFDLRWNSTSIYMLLTVQIKSPWHINSVIPCRRIFISSSLMLTSPAFSPWTQLTKHMKKVMMKHLNLSLLRKT